MRGRSPGQRWGVPRALCEWGWGAPPRPLQRVAEFAVRCPDPLQSFYSSGGSWLELHLRHA